MLSGIAFFSDLTEADRAKVRERCTRMGVKRKEVVVTQGGDGRSMFVVESGRLRISAVSEEGKEVGFGVLEAGDTFGEMSMLDGEARSATVTAIERCDLWRLDHDEFRSLMIDQPDLAINLMVILAQRLRHTTRLYQDSVFLDVPARLAQFLLQFSQRESEDSDVPVLDFTLSQYELGTLVNASRESVNKQLREWEQSGIIQSKRGRIRLLDMESLRSQAAGEH